MNDQNALYQDNGYMYKDGKIAGRKVSVYFYANMLCVYPAGFGREVGRSFGAVGSAVGGAIDTAVNAKAQTNGPELSVDYSNIQSVTIKKSLLNGAGIVFTLSNGSTFKISTPAMALGGVKKIYQQIATLIRAANQNVAFDPPLIP